MDNRITSLKMEHITKRFPGVLAADDISISVGEGEVLALVGENGAGKTTLMNILMGIYPQDEGRILINGNEVRFRGPEDAFNAGLGMVHQQYMLVQNMTVTENVALGYKKAWKHGILDLKMVRERVVEVSTRYGLAVNPDAYIWQLSVGEQQRVELVKTLSLGAKFLILDEPTSALTPQETDELIVLLKNMIVTVKRANVILEDAEEVTKVLRKRTEEVDGVLDDVSGSVKNISKAFSGNENVLKQVSTIISGITTLIGMFRNSDDK